MFCQVSSRINDPCGEKLLYARDVGRNKPGGGAEAPAPSNLEVDSES